MNWGNYDQGQSGGQGGQGGQDPWGREPQSAPGFTDPYAPDPAPPAGGYGQSHDPYGSQAGNPYAQSPGGGAPYGPPHPAYGGFAYHYDAAHPPRPAVGFVDAGKLFFKNYAVFHGRASRSEFWWVQLWGLILGIILTIPLVVLIAGGVQSGSSSATSGFTAGLMAWLSIAATAYLGLVVPSLSLQVRRLHDAGFSGFFTLFHLMSWLYGLTGLVPLIMCAMASSPSGVKYDNPNGTQPATVAPPAPATDFWR
ncbi:MAG: DUF805 domain-containing protein [Propionibacteriaceae bacterium]|nr:DUF805 domain-containing protein [Propionibacteriaceae bacterium]